VKKARGGGRIKKIIRRETALALFILLILVLVGWRNPTFVTPASLDDVATDTAILVAMALGQMLVILTRGIDLSVASTLALAGEVVAILSHNWPEMPVALTILVAGATGLGLGAINGGLIAGVGIPPIVTTLGTLSIYRGLIYVLSGGGWINAHELGDGFLAFPLDRLLGLTHLVWFAALVAIVAGLGLGLTRFGREIYALGGNPVAARYCGLSEGRLIFAVYCLSGLIAGLCGYLWVARYSVAYTQLATGFELQVIAACVIGGVSIAGGIGTVAGCVLGAVLLGLIANALPAIEISPFWQTAIAGTVILVAVIVNARTERRPGKIILKAAEP
jgi:rhamnose transport system permease protein